MQERRLPAAFRRLARRISIREGLISIAAGPKDFQGAENGSTKLRGSSVAELSFAHGRLSKSTSQEAQAKHEHKNSPGPRAGAGAYAATRSSHDGAAGRRGSPAITEDAGSVRHL